MSFSFAGRHMEIGAALTHHAVELCEKLAQKYDDELSDVSIVMTKDSFLFITDLSVKMSRGESFHARADSKEPYASFESALQKISTQVKKFKDKGNSQKAVKSDLNIEIVTEEPEAPSIISEIIEELPTLSVAEATNKLLERKHEVIMFYNKVTKLVNVVYQRKDGKIGWIDYK